MPVLCDDLQSRLHRNTVVVAPDAGAVRQATRYAQRLGAPLVVMHKRRESGRETIITHLVGEVKGRDCLIVDDMISTAGTITQSVEALLAAGARPNITVAATHGLLLPNARERLSHEAIREVVVTDTVPVDKVEGPRLHVVSTAPLLAAALRRFIVEGWVSDSCE